MRCSLLDEAERGSVRGKRIEETRLWDTDVWNKDRGDGRYARRGSLSLGEKKLISPQLVKERLALQD